MYAIHSPASSSIARIMLCQRCQSSLYRLALIPGRRAAPFARFFHSSRLRISPSSSADEAAAAPEGSSRRLHPQSTVSAGTVLRGLNYMKNKPEVLALEDHEYPEWLWNLDLDSKSANLGTADVKRT